MGGGTREGEAYAARHHRVVPRSARVELALVADGVDVVGVLVLGGGDGGGV